jgi:hypothetical protein
MMLALETAIRKLHQIATGFDQDSQSRFMTRVHFEKCHSRYIDL